MKKWTVNIGLVALFLLLPLLALAQGAVPSPDQLGPFLGTLLDAIRAGQWPTVGVLALIAAIWLVKKFASKIPGVIGTFFATSEGGTVIAFLTAGVAAFAAAFFGGVPITGSLVLSALKAGCVAIGGWVAVRRLLRLLVPLAQKIPGTFGQIVTAALGWLSGYDVVEAVRKAGDAAASQPTPQAGADIAAGLDPK